MNFLNNRAEITMSDCQLAYLPSLTQIIYKGCNILHRVFPDFEELLWMK